MGASETSAEVRRLERLHETFLEVRNRVAAGDTLSATLKRVSLRSLRAPYRPYSIKSLLRLYCQWRRSPKAKTLARKYGPGIKRIPSALLNEFFRRLRANPSESVKAIYNELRAEWDAGFSLPGIGARHPTRKFDSAFPSSRSFARHIADKLPVSWSEQRHRRRRAIAELQELDAVLERHLKPSIVRHG